MRVETAESSPPVRVRLLHCVVSHLPTFQLADTQLVGSCRVVRPDTGESSNDKYLFVSRSDWPTLRNHLHLSLLSTLPLFQKLGPPKSYHPPQSTPASPRTKDASPPSESLLLSPAQPTSSTDQTPTPPRPANVPRSIEVEPSSSPNSRYEFADHLPSTAGGLVLPPFPPLDLSRRRRSPIAAPKPTTPIGGLLRPSIGFAPAPPSLTTSGPNVFEDEWDEDVVIGGKKLVSFMEDEQGKKEVERVGSLLEEFDYPPFTIQRLAELLLSPTSQHRTLGKFLRAVEKALLVTTPWEEPSYTSTPSTTFFQSRQPISSSSPATSDASDESTLPPGSMTPMFSPIPFLKRPDTNNSGGIEHGAHEHEGLMSPLVLGETSSSGIFSFNHSPLVRSPTPEPEETEDVIVDHPSATDSTDPSHQPYLGRVDELDSGPSDPTAKDDGNGTGTGEGGNMTPHGMSDKPVAISSTTTLGEQDRKIAVMPKVSLGERFVSAGSGPIEE
ncbi:serine/threonine-protein phosphatase 4 regulatory subunit 2, partial [Tremellales sp. Uapishka_1]